ncbi:endosomal P24B protein [Trypanosoma grayi]|uniref:endosomal P24B protein n=1 Tax=Trypanosoma grayi TaxID=71804 RepID=UPI0004F4BD11|nr:endosomal P24B protein [Trypanosoma grayi]KEG11333.1 endosomal P24B protein [Trypanosoma grayi]
MADRAAHASWSPAVLLLLLAVAAVPLVADAAATRIDPGEKLCVQEVVPLQSSVTFQFQVIAGGQREISASLVDQDGRVIKVWEDAAEGIHDVLARDGVKVVTACLDNSNAHYVSKWVTFHFRYHVDYASVAKQSELDPIERKVDGIAHTMRSAQALQMQLRMLQKEHRATIEEANERLLQWGVFQVVALVGMSLFQLYFLKRFLERKSFV